MRWRGYRSGHTTRGSIVAGLLAVVALAAVVIAVHGRGGSPGVDAFNACISQTRFLVTTERRSSHQIIDTIKDRANGTVVGEFAVLPSLRAAATFTSNIGPPKGTGEGNGRMVLFTNIPTGRDTKAILTCGNPEFPLTP